MTNLKFLAVNAKFAVAASLCAVCALGAAGQAQPDAQGGAQLGEQSVLAGKQEQGANASKDTASGATNFAAGTVISAELTSSLDSKKLKQGDAVNARTTDTLKSTDGRTIIPKGAKITGHVTQSSSRASGQSESALGLAFDEAVLKNGEKMPLSVTIQALGAPSASSADANRNPDVAPLSGTAQGAGTAGTMGRGGVAAPSTIPGTPNNGPTGGVDNPANYPNEAAGPGGSSEPLNGNSHGVVGLKNLRLSELGGGAQGSLINCTGKSVHLDTGTRLILVTQGPTGK
jgi:hypothetical protein